MSTLCKFTRSLETLSDFDGEDDPPSGDGFAVGSTVALSQNSISFNQMFVSALVEHLCHVHESNPARREKLFHFMCEMLRRANIALPSLDLDVFSSIRQQYRTSFVRLLQAAVQSLGQDTSAVRSTSLVKAQNLQLSFEPRLPVGPTISLQNAASFLTSKYRDEYEQLELISTGAYGAVYKARKKSDGICYAVKKIILEDLRHDTWLRAHQEAKYIASMSHPNIIRYYDNWFEYDFISRSSAAREDSSDMSRIVSLKSSNGSNHNAHFSSAIVPLNRVTSIPATVSAEESSNESIVFCESSNSIHDGSCRTEHNGYRRKRGDGRPTNFDTVQTTSTDAVAFLSSPLQLVLYIQMELCEMNLREWLDTRNRAPHVSANTDTIQLVNRPECSRILKQLLKGVDYFHSRALIHRDIKPLNLFLLRDASDQYQLKIGDFGLARLHRHGNMPSSSSPLTPRPSNVHSAWCADVLTEGVGTDLYAAPEQLSSTSYSNKCDMYSIGLVMFELFRPFTSTDSERGITLNRLRGGAMDTWFEKHFPDQAVIVNQLIDRNPERRPTANELLASRLFFSKQQMIDDLRQQVAAQDAALRDRDLLIERLQRHLREQQAEVNRLQARTVPNTNFTGSGHMV